MLSSKQNIPEELYASGAVAWTWHKSELVKFRHLWKIDNFFYNNDEITSPDFVSKEFPDRKWNLHIRRDKENVHLDLRLVFESTRSFKYSWKSSVLHSDGKTLNFNGGGVEFTAACTKTSQLKDLVCIKDLRNSHNGLLPRGTLCLVTEITMITDPHIFTPDNVEVNPLNTPQEDLSKIFDTSLHSDVTFVVDNKEFKSHKAILALRSPVFAAMFEHQEMEENKNSLVVITDMDSNVFKEFLNFLYSSKSADIDKMAPELLAAADKYDIKHLKTMCESVLERDLTVDTVIETLILADRYCSLQLKTRSLSVIKDNISAIALKAEWCNMMKNFPHLITEITLYNAKK